MALGLFDRPNKASTMLRFPELYKISQSKTDFNMTVFWSWMFNAFLHSILLYFTCAGSLSHGKNIFIIFICYYFNLFI